jgi:hypothetical protein
VAFKIFEVYKRKIIIAALLILISLVIFYNFKIDRKESVPGNYESSSPSLYEKAKFAAIGIECFNAGTKLILFPDSTFVFTDSNDILTGRWNQRKDLVTLHFLPGKYVNDSLAKKMGKPEVPQEDYLLKWNNPDLYHFFTNSDDKCVEIFRLK